jgi:hypothetical protein
MILSRNPLQFVGLRPQIGNGTFYLSSTGLNIFQNDVHLEQHGLAVFWSMRKQRSPMFSQLEPNPV